jgi:hypothetical protein
MPVVGRTVRRKSLCSLAALAVCYAAALWWVHALIRTPLNLQYFKQYVTLRCSAQHTERSERPRSRETLLELEQALKRCQDIEVEVDGTWGGASGTPSVRLKILKDAGATTEFEYYSADVSLVVGIASVRYELTPVLYYLNF